MMKRTSTIFGLILATALSVPAFAQTKSAPVKPEPPVVSVQTPEPTEVEKLKLENIQLKFSLLQTEQQRLQTEQQKLQSDYQATIQAITSEHPGYQWDAKTSSLIAVTKATPSK
jgi:Skp family chaperone for outer membrane proteins